MKRLGIWTMAAMLALGLAGRASAIVSLNFEGLGDLETVEEFYNGGTGGGGINTGTNYGVSFSDNALALIDSDAGGSGNFGGEPSASTILFFLDGPAATMNVAAGFDTGFSFFYSTQFGGFVDVYDGLNGTGTLLTSIALPVTPQDGGDPNGDNSPFVAIGVLFSGIAKSVDFGGTVNQIGFDNITFGTDNPVVPEPASVVVWSLLGLVSLGVHRVRRNAKV